MESLEMLALPDLKETPSSLNDAIKNGLEHYGFNNNEKLCQYIELHVKDFVSQKVQIACFKVKEEEPQDLLLLLFKELFRSKDEKAS